MAKLALAGAPGCSTPVRPGRSRRRSLAARQRGRRRFVHLAPGEAAIRRRWWRRGRAAAILAATAQEQSQTHAGYQQEDSLWDG